MRILFIGGTGAISAASSAYAVEAGHDLTLLNRGRTMTRQVEGARTISAEVTDAASLRAALGDAEFDAVVNFIAYTPEQVQRDAEVLAGRVGQYVFISSASVYEKPPTRLPITEATPLRNPFWQYSRDKIAGELLLQEAYRDRGFPLTIVRPSHTYDRTRIPLAGGWTAIDRMHRGLPVVVHGDGSSLWTLTHSRDFARGFVPLLGNPLAVGEVVHITSDEVLTWHQITTIMGRAAGVEPEIVHATSVAIAREIPRLAAMHLGDRTHSHIFDNSRIRSLVPDFQARIPFAEGAREIVEWYDADPARRVIDPEADAAFDRLVAAAR